MRILLGSGGFRTPERIAALNAVLQSFLGDLEKILFVPYALGDHDGYVRRLEEKGIAAGYRLEGIHRAPDPIVAVERAPAIFVGGGNTFRLLADLYRHHLLEPIRQRVQAGFPYLGISAGCNVACPPLPSRN